jgi:4-carboxymuconolactone decarboxylase
VKLRRLLRKKPNGARRNAIPNVQLATSSRWNRSASGRTAGRPTSGKLHSESPGYMLPVRQESWAEISVAAEEKDMKRVIVLALCVAVGIGSALMMPEVRVYSSDSDKEQRFPLLKVEQLNEQQRPFADEILKVSSIGISGPYNMMLRSPVMGERMFAMLDYLRFNTSVPRRLNEFAILIQARLWTSQVEWTAHYPLALKAGLPEAVANDLKIGKRPASMQPDEAAVYDLCMDLANNHVVSDASFKKAREVFSDQQIVDLITVSGVYITLAMLSNTAEDATPGGKTPPLQPLLAR